MIKLKNINNEISTLLCQDNSEENNSEKNNSEKNNSEKNNLEKNNLEKNNFEKKNINLEEFINTKLSGNKTNSRGFYTIELFNEY